MEALPFLPLTPSGEREVASMQIEIRRPRLYLLAGADWWSVWIKNELYSRQASRDSYSLPTSLKNHSTHTSSTLQKQCSPSCVLHHLHTPRNYRRGVCVYEQRPCFSGTHSYVTSEILPNNFYQPCLASASAALPYHPEWQAGGSARVTLLTVSILFVLFPPTRAKNVVSHALFRSESEWVVWEAAVQEEDSPAAVSN